MLFRTVLLRSIGNVWGMILLERPSKTGGLEFQHLKLEAFF
jgi:hypothetical protein